MATELRWHASIGGPIDPLRQGVFVDGATYEERIEEFFKNKDIDREDMRMFIGRLLDIANGIGRKASRSIAISVLLVAAFFLLSSAKLTEAELLGVKVQDVTFFRLALPVASLFFLLRFLMLVEAFGIHENMYYRIMQRYWPECSTSDLDTLLIAWDGPVSVMGRNDFYFTGRPTRLRDAIGNAEIAIGLVLPVLFAIYAYWTLFSDPKVSLVATSISLALSVILCVTGTLHVIFVNASK
ncbi:hypothetical protein [Micromonospora trifolii]|uniref:hypothetical protein n=1 Tax=Micromonospora trifolii TaxID=2911208 RepID=UPI003CEBE4CF